MVFSADHLITDIDSLSDQNLYGRVTKVLGLLIEMKGFTKGVSIGSVIHLHPNENKVVPCEVVGFQEDTALLMPFGTVEGIGPGCKGVLQNSTPVIYPSEKWLGRVINAIGEPVDGGPSLQNGSLGIPIKNTPPSAHTRTRVGEKLDLGVRSVNTFTSICQGQRMGIFAGSGVGKSVLLSMMAKYTEAEIAVIGLVGERGREVQEFLQDDLGEEGLKKSVVVVATGDEPPLMRRQAAYMTLSIAEYFRKQGKQVLCMMDSVTRFAMAQREIGLSAGEPPTTKGYPPTTFSELSRLLERAGPGSEGEGSITAVFSILVEGDDHNEPIADAARGVLDGHIVMERKIADRGRYPAINILKSVSRMMPDCLDGDQQQIVKRARELISIYEDMAELIRLGAYRKGSDPKVDEAIKYYDEIEAYLNQQKKEQTSIDEGFAKLAHILGMEITPKESSQTVPAQTPENAQAQNAGSTPPPPVPPKQKGRSYLTKEQLERLKKDAEQFKN